MALLTLTEAKLWLRITPSETAEDGLVQRLIDSSTAYLRDSTNIRWPIGNELDKVAAEYVLIRMIQSYERAPEDKFHNTLQILMSKLQNVGAISNPLSALTGIEENGATALSLVPGFSPAVYAYTATVNTASTWVKLTPTVDADDEEDGEDEDHTITITVDGVEVVSGERSEEITLGAAGTDTEIEIVVTELDEDDEAMLTRTYTVTVTRPEP